jgi:hypothetical protein
LKFFHILIVLLIPETHWEEVDGDPLLILFHSSS